jgi:hypothetical protein
MAGDMREDRYGSLPATRKVDMYRDYVALGVFALELADDALDAIELALSSGTVR